MPGRLFLKLRRKLSHAQIDPLNQIVFFRKWYIAFSSMSEISIWWVWTYLQTVFYTLCSIHILDRLEPLENTNDGQLQPTFTNYIKNSSVPDSEYYLLFQKSYVLELCFRVKDWARVKTGSCRLMVCKRDMLATR